MLWTRFHANRSSHFLRGCRGKHTRFWYLNKFFGKKKTNHDRGRRGRPLSAPAGVCGTRPQSDGLRWNCVTSISQTARGKWFSARCAARHSGTVGNGARSRKPTGSSTTGSSASSEPETVSGRHNGRRLFLERQGMDALFKGLRPGRQQGQLDHSPRRRGLVRNAEGNFGAGKRGFQQYVPEPADKNKALAPITSFVLGSYGDLWIGNRRRCISLQRIGLDGIQHE